MTFFISSHSTAIYTIHNTHPWNIKRWGERENKLKRGSRRGAQVEGVKVSKIAYKETLNRSILDKWAGHNLCFYPFTWAVATGHTDNTVYTRMSLNKNMVHALEMSQVFPAAMKGWEWRGKNLWESKLQDWKTSSYWQIARLIQSRHFMLCSTSSDGISPLSTERCAQIHQSWPVFT